MLLHFSKLIVKYQDNIQKTWSMIIEATGKEKYNKKNSLKNLYKK